MSVGKSGQVAILGSSNNLLLRSLAPGDARLLAAHLFRVNFCAGEIVFHPDSALDRVVFPESAIISFRAGLGPGPETAMVGREGLVGWPLLLGAESAATSAVAHYRAGSALVIRARPLREACCISMTLQTSLLGYVDSLMRQMTGTIASMPDSVEKRVARWLLMVHDRSGEDALALTHDHIAWALDIRRASVTDCLHLIEGEEVIRCTRGRIVIRDRTKLAALAGASYGPFEAHPFDPSDRRIRPDLTPGIVTRSL